MNVDFNDSFSDTVFVEHTDIDCLHGDDLDNMASTSDVEPCKEWCARNEVCGGFVVGYGKCSFKSLEWKDDLIWHRYGVTYLKETV